MILVMAAVTKVKVIMNMEQIITMETVKIMVMIMANMMTTMTTSMVTTAITRLIILPHWQKTQKAFLRLLLAILA